MAHTEERKARALAAREIQRDITASRNGRAGRPTQHEAQLRRWAKQNDRVIGNLMDAWKPHGCNQKERIMTTAELLFGTPIHADSPLSRLYADVCRMRMALDAADAADAHPERPAQ